MRQESSLFAADERVGLALKDGSVYTPDDLMVGVWRAAFPSLDVMQELRVMQAWLLCNAAKRKTARGIQRFVMSWLSRSAQRAPRASHTSTRSRSLHEDLTDTSWAAAGHVSHDRCRDLRDAAGSTSTRSRSLHEDLTDTSWAK